MRKIFLIGGGEITKKETLKIDRNIIKESKGKSSRILFFPTAANDSNGYIKNFVEYFLYLGCNNILWAKLTQEPLTDIIKKMDWSTVIYFGGGNTEYLIKLFKKRGVARYLKTYLDKGVVLAGMSAGAIALSKISVISEINDNLKFAHGFGFLTDIICLPHYQKKYKNKLNQIKERFPNKIVFGIPEKSAVYLRGNTIRYYNKCIKI